MFVYKYNEVALLSKQQSERYKNIISLLNTDPKLDINAELNKIEKYDVDISGALEEIAFKRSAIQLSLEDTTELTLYQRIIAKLAGEYFS
ncbi:hypothetical protein [Phocoenobacter skyensis]|uniref:Uncharacterized protein n=1 Tax=Phocoenobacter skyensis TaxID=97481 RepID=A0ABT9JI96_9PAST|nr:hypothetical protein [Pasteurella skyensis]MDP8078363.1 hypothetical protein [Pasteurella skyensis]MDP8084545.1 hypothetical protein [Pasteurella skyensis]